MSPWLPASIGAVSAAGLGLAWVIRRKGLHRWLGTYLKTRSERRDWEPSEPIHIFLCVADHYEPKLGGAPPVQAAARVARWADEYPKLCESFRDSDGRPPRHSFFYPEEEYEPEYLDALAKICRDGYGEVEIHLHHDHDTANGLREKLLRFKKLLRDRHGLLGTDRQSGETAYGFIHGNWALDNARSDGRWCGVNNELDILRETGCYADFTLPSAPSETQTRKINRIYWAVDDPAKPKSHNWGMDIGTGPVPENALLLIQGPLLLNWKRRKFGLMPAIENACLQGSQPPSEARLDLWIRTRIRVPQRPEWVFVKLHTHGANEFNMPVLLGEPMRRFHQALQRRAAENPNFRFHYVSAREMNNLARAAVAGVGSVSEGLDFAVSKPPLLDSSVPSAIEARM